MNIRDDYIFQSVSAGKKGVTELAEELGITKQRVSIIFQREAKTNNFPLPAKSVKLNLQMHQLYDHIVKYIDETGHSPTQSELAELMNCVQGWIHYLLKHLMKHGYITYEYKQQRSIKILKEF